MKATPSKVIKYALYTVLVFTPLQLPAAEADQPNQDIQTTQPRQQGKEERTREPPQRLAPDQLDAVKAGQELPVGATLVILGLLFGG